MHTIYNLALNCILNVLSDKDIYNVTKDFYLKSVLFFWTINLFKNLEKTYHGFYSKEINKNYK